MVEYFNDVHNNKHCLNAYGYFKDEISQYMELTNDTNIDVKEFHRLVEEGHKELKAIRQKGKPATLDLASLHSDVYRRTV